MRVKISNDNKNICCIISAYKSYCKEIKNLTIKTSYKIRFFPSTFL